MTYMGRHFSKYHDKSNVFFVCLFFVFVLFCFFAKIAKKLSKSCFFQNSFKRTVFSQSLSLADFTYQSTFHSRTSTWNRGQDTFQISAFRVSTLLSRLDCNHEFFLFFRDIATLGTSQNCLLVTFLVLTFISLGRRINWAPKNPPLAPS